MNITRRPLLMGAAAAGLTAGHAFAQTAADFIGEWNGVLDAGSARLRLRLVIAEGPAATVFSLDQGNTPIPAGETRIEGVSIRIELPSIGARYQGRLSGGRIEGQFTQNGTLPLVFVRGEAPEPPPPETLTEARLEALRAQAGSPAFGAAAASRDGRRVSFAVGAHAAGQPQPVTTADLWHLGSITKSMTATLVARCVEAGAIRWEDTIGAVLGAAVPDMRAEYRDVAFRHLLCHRSGLPANIPLPQLIAFPREREDARQDRVAYARIALAQAPNGPKESHFEYSNSGFVIAGAMLEARLGATWESLVRDQVFAPLGMESAGQGAPGTPGAFDQPIGHAPTGANGALEAYPPGGPLSDNPAVLGPAGRVHAAFDDMLKYLAAHRDRTPFLRRESWEMLHTPPFGGEYAMGWVRRGDMLWHNGSNTLWYAEVMFDAGRGVAAIAATNDGRTPVVRQPIGAALTGAAMAVA